MVKYLRIAMTALSLTACVLLVALWMRSYWRYDWLGGLSFIPQGNEFRPRDGCLLESADVVVVLYIGNLREMLSYLGQFVGSSPALPHLRVTGNDDESDSLGFGAKTYANGMFRGSAPHWFFVLVAGAAAAVHWITWRFRLRTLLIATALIGVVLGIATAMS